MKTIFNLILSFFFYTAVQCQVMGVFTLNSKTSINCNICFYSDGLYEILLEVPYPHSDVVTSILISVGTFKEKSSKLFLSDSYNKCNMVFSIVNNTIIPNKTFITFVNNKFVKTDWLISNLRFSSKLKNNSLDNERIIFNSLYRTSHKLVFGEFENDAGFNLNLQANYNYELKYENILISKGVWNREKNELTLKDKNFNLVFYVFINDNSLKLRIFPGEDDYFILHKKL